MSLRGFAMLVSATTLLGAASGVAQAAPAPAITPDATQTATTPMDFTVRADGSPAVPGGQVMKWDAAKNRWGLTFSVRQPDTRETTLNDIQAGAYYKITPAWRAGGAFSFGNEQLPAGPKLNTPDQPRVQFETKFKF